MNSYSTRSNQRSFKRLCFVWRRLVILILTCWMGSMDWVGAQLSSQIQVYPEVVRMEFPDGFEVVDSMGKVQKRLPGRQLANVKGQRNEVKATYYISDWSWKRLQQGKVANWMQTLGAHAPRPIVVPSTAPQSSLASSGPWYEAKILDADGPTTLRDGPGQKTGRVTRIEQSEPFLVRPDSNSLWWPVRLVRDGRIYEGYLRQRLVRIVEHPSWTSAVIRGDSDYVNVRVRPKSSSGIVTVILPNQSFEVLPSTETWWVCRVLGAREQGFIHSDLVLRQYGDLQASNRSNQGRIIQIQATQPPAPKPSQRSQDSPAFSSKPISPEHQSSTANPTDDATGIVPKEAFVELFSMSTSQLRGIGVRAAPEITTHIHFKYDSTELADTLSQRQLKAVAEAFNDVKLKPYRFIIEGHTDSQGDESYNLALSQRRAQSIVDYLVREYNVEPSRLEPVGKGEFEPVSSNDSDTGRQKNRRVIFIRTQ